MKTTIIRGLPALREQLSKWRRGGSGIAVVPTMGALHAGHLSLAEAAKAGGDRVIVTIFVNPKQFNNPEDLAKYPRTEEADARLLAPLGVDAIFVPSVDEVYPPGFSTNVSVGGVSDVLEGKFRPGHFDGVATIVAKLFLMTDADRAYFGEKDYQQLMVVRKMARDLNMNIEVVGCPTLRDPDGLAMSSRNTRLSDLERAIAPQLHRQLQSAALAIKGGEAVPAALETARLQLVDAGFGPVEYIELRSAVALESMNLLDRPARLVAAAWLGKVRLIDNIAVNPA